MTSPRSRFNPSFRRSRNVIVVLTLFSCTTMTFAASQRCTGNGFSVWCHTFWFGYEKCNLYDRNGDLVSEFVEPGTACQSISEVAYVP